MNQDNIVSLRLDNETISFLDQTRGNLKHATAIKLILQWLKQYGIDYTKENILKTNEV